MRKDIKNEIIEATIKLIEEKGSNPDDITISDICSRVGIGVGLINYHFQTKDNLIRQCVRRIISNASLMTDDVRESLKDAAPKEKLRSLLKLNCDYLVRNENISRISIQTDMMNDEIQDNTRQTVDAYLPLVYNAYAGEFSQEDLKRRMYLLILTVQNAFLRTALLKDQTGMDFYDPQHRGELVDSLVDSYFGRLQ